MKPPRLALLGTFVLAFSGPAIRAQDGATTVVVLTVDQALRDCLANAADVVMLRPRLEAYRTALGTSSEAAVVALLLSALTPAPPDRVPTLEEARITELLDRISFHRRRGRPERMLPALIVLQRLLPDDPRVLFAGGEAFGVQSPVFDAKQAEMAFARLYDQLLTPPEQPKTPRAQARELAKFLPELAGAVDRTDWFRQRLRGFCETLRDGQPIGLWKLRDPRLEELQEDLRVVLPRGFQRELIDVLEQMRAIHPDDPASCYMLAQVHASLGPAHDPERAVELLRRFLELTAEERFEQRPDADSPIASRDDVAGRLVSLQLASAKDQLQALRIAAKETLIELTPAKGKPQPLLFHPELAVLERKVAELEKGMAKEEGELAKLEARIEKTQGELDAAKADYERWKREAGARRRGVADPQPYVDAINSRKALLAQLEKKREPLKPAVEARRRVLAAHRARLQQFAR